MDTLTVPLSTTCMKTIIVSLVLCFNYADIMYRDVLRYCFGPLVQRDLTSFAYEWNNHRVRYSRMADVPGGIPEVLFHMPHSQGINSVFTCIILISNRAENQGGIT